MINATTPYKNNVGFKGYAACPINNLYLQDVYDPLQGRYTREAAKELNDIGKTEGFNVFYHSKNSIYNANQLDDNFIKNRRQDNYWKSYYKNDKDLEAYRPLPFLQDSIMFLPNGKIKTYHLDENSPNISDFGKILGKNIKPIEGETEGGNIFFGQKNDGTSYILLGEKSLSMRPNESLLEKKDQNIDKINKLAEQTGVDPSNIFLVPQTLKKNTEAIDFHIDLVIRPLKYPYVLVNDPKCVKNKLDGEDSKEDLKSVDQFYSDAYKNKSLAQTDAVVKALKEQGFKPIRVPGMFGEYENYMNSIVHERPNGDLVYITNNGKHNELFEKDLKDKVPDIKEVHFIKNHLLADGGGIHCMSSEEPNFEKWA